MTTTINTSLQNLQADSAGSAFDDGFIDIYTGPQPAPNDPPTGTLLLSFQLPSNAYLAASGGVVTSIGQLSTTGAGTGMAGYAQQRNATNTRWMYGSVSLPGGGGDVEISRLNINLNNLVFLNVSTITQPSGA